MTPFLGCLKLIFSRCTVVHFLVLSEQNIARFVVGSSVLIVIDRPQIAQRTEDDHLLSSDQVRRRGRVGLFVGMLPAFERRVRKGEIAFGARLQFGNLAAKQVSGTRARARAGHKSKRAWLTTVSPIIRLGI